MTTTTLTTTTTTTTAAALDDDDQKRNLIEQATTRLRRLQLEEQFSGMMAGLMDLQTQSKYLYDQLSHAMSTTQNLPDFDIGQQHQQMDLLEIQCKLYQQVMLHQGFPTAMKTDQALTIMDNMNDDDDDDDDQDSTTMSRHSSRSMMPSLFSSRSISSLTSSDSSATSISEFTDMECDHNNADETCSSGGDLCATAAAPDPEKKAPIGDHHLGRSYQRRLRVKYHRQRYQYLQQQMKNTDDQDSVLADLAMASTTPSLLPLSRQHQDLQRNAPTMHLIDKMETSPPTSFFPLTSSPSPYSSSFSSLYQPPPPPYSYPYYSTNDTTGYCDDTKADLGFTDYEVNSTNVDTHRHDHYHHGDGNATVDDFMDQMDAIVKDIDDCDGYDDAFFEDMAFLLDQPIQANNLTPSPLATHQLHHHHRATNNMDYWYLRSSSSSCGSAIDLSAESTHGPTSSSSSYSSSTSASSPSSPYIDHLCHSGWQWCRFLSVLSASYMVSLLKGPDDLLMD